MNKNVCTKCLLRDMETADKAMIEKYKAAIKVADRVTDDVYEDRLQICTSCDKLNAGTCAACGCYVEIRAVSSIAHCPKKKW